MPVDHKNKIAFVHIPRTGGQSLCEYWPMTVEDKHEPASKIRELYPDYFIFTILRDDWDRIQSANGWRLSNDEIEAIKDNPTDQKEWPNDFFLDAPVDLIIDYDNWDVGVTMLRKTLELKETHFKRLDRAKV